MSRTAADLLVETLIAWDIDTIFGLPGDGINGINGIMDMPRRGILTPLEG